MLLLLSEYLYLLSFVLVFLLLFLCGCVYITYDRLNREYVELRSVA